MFSMLYIKKKRPPPMPPWGAARAAVRSSGALGATANLAKTYKTQGVRTSPAPSPEQICDSYTLSNNRIARTQAWRQFMSKMYDSLYRQDRIVAQQQCVCPHPRPCARPCARVSMHPHRCTSAPVPAPTC